MDKEDDSSCSFIDDREAEFELWLRDPKLAERLQYEEWAEIVSYWRDWHMYGDRLLPCQGDIEQPDEITPCTHNLSKLCEDKNLTSSNNINEKKRSKDTHTSYTHQEQQNSHLIHNLSSNQSYKGKQCISHSKSNSDSTCEDKPNAIPKETDDKKRKVEKWLES